MTGINIGANVDGSGNLVAVSSAAGAQIATETTLAALSTKVTTVNTGAVVLAAGSAEVGNVKNSGTFPVQATLSAETTKVIGTVNQGTSPWITTANIGTTNGLALDTSVNGLLLAQASTTSNQTGPLIQGACASAQPTYVDGKTMPLSLTTSGGVRAVLLGSGAQIGSVVQATASNFNATVVGTGTFATQSAITAASGAVASGAFASGSIAAGAVAAGATSFVKLEDVASADADAGVACLAVRKATPANTSGSDGDYEFLQMSGGRLWASTNVDQINGVTPLMGNGASGTGALRVSIASDSTGQVTLATGANTIGALTANQSVNLNQIAGGVAISGGVTGSAATGGNVAHDGVNSGNPDYAGGEAIAFGTNPTAVSAADRTKFYANRAGIPFMLGGHPNIVTIEAAYTAAQTNTAIVTISTGLKIVVTEVEAICANSNTVDVGVRIGFGASTTPTTTGVVLTHPGIAASSGSGVIRGTGSGILGVGADNEDLRITCDVPTGGSIRALVSYFTIES